MTDKKIVESVEFVDGKLTRVKKSGEKPDDIPHKKSVWLPLVRKTVDTSKTTNTVSTVEDIREDDKVIRLTTIRDRTKAELAEIASVEKQHLIDTMTSDKIMIGVLDGLLEIINEIRSNAKPAMSRVTREELLASIRTHI